MKSEDFIVKTIGKQTISSPLKLSKVIGDGVYDYITPDDRILFDTSLKNYRRCVENGETPISFEKAGPHERLYFDASKTRAAIVTCGGLCPGLNNVIRSLTLQLWYRYNVRHIYGIQYGYSGFVPESNYPYIELTPDYVTNIHLFGGTVLGSSRGSQEVEDIVDSLERMNVNLLFTIGGDGTLRGAHAIHEEIERRGLKIAVGGVPKTIDNDISFIERSFGFETAFSIANSVIRDAHNEARGAPNGVALVKLMGRDSGFIAANAALSMQEVNFVLIPEIEFDLRGENGFYAALKKRLDESGHAVVVVAEGAGQFLFEDQEVRRDASGNIKHNDIGMFLKKHIPEAFKEFGMDVTLKYIDPSYIIRSAAANANDSKFCNQLARNAVHAAMAGKTDFVVGYWNSQFTVIPIPVTVKERKRVDIESELWWGVLEATGQPTMMKN
ncbi:MAG: ATP-dependent 6-phosphofructokinase [Ignavibacteriales bacterium]|nr:ATP-dependent 6-phosphofructokinase [Ignavibacteriales bacterium]